MKPNISLTDATSRNSTFVDSLAGRHRQAFTLIELLVVISLITLLLGFLLPGLRTTKKKANLIQCQCRLKALYMAVQMYANQHGGRFPNVTDYSQVPLLVKKALEPYVNSEEIFSCPDDPKEPTSPGDSYDWRVTHDLKTSIAGVRLDLLRHPNRVIIAGERSHGWHISDMINVLFADGHVDQVTKEEWFRNITTPLEFL